MVSINQLIWKDDSQAKRPENWKPGVVEKAEAFRVLATLKEGLGEPDFKYLDEDCQYHVWEQGELKRVLFIDGISATRE